MVREREPSLVINALENATIVVIEGVARVQVGIFNGDEAVFEVPGVRKTVHHGHVSVCIIVEGPWRVVATCDRVNRSQGMRAGWIAGCAADATTRAGNSAVGKVTEIGDRDAFFHVLKSGTLGEQITKAIVAVSDLAVIAGWLGRQGEGMLHPLEAIDIVVLEKLSIAAGTSFRRGGSGDRKSAWREREW